MRVTHGSLYYITVDFIQVIVYYYINNSVREALDGVFDRVRAASAQ